MAIADDLAQIALQEKQLQLSSFGEEIAWKLGSRLRALAVERGFSVAIDVRRFAQPLFYTTLPGTVPDNAEWVRRKGNLTALFHRSSYALGLEMTQKNTDIYNRYGLSAQDYASHGGSFPLRVVNAGFVGTVTVSGLPPRHDHELAIEGLCLELGQPYEGLRLPPEE
jgi:uncharacterized protein (UPF0303 family)